MAILGSECYREQTWFDFDSPRLFEFEFGWVAPNDRLILPNPGSVFALVVTVIAVSAACLERDESVLELKDIASVMREQFIAGNLALEFVGIADKESKIAQNDSERSYSCPTHKALCEWIHLLIRTGIGQPLSFSTAAVYFIHCRHLGIVRPGGRADSNRARPPVWLRSATRRASPLRASRVNPRLLQARVVHSERSGAAARCGALLVAASATRTRVASAGGRSCAGKDARPRTLEGRATH